VGRGTKKKCRENPASRARRIHLLDFYPDGRTWQRRTRAGRRPLDRTRSKSGPRQPQTPKAIKWYSARLPGLAASGTGPPGRHSCCVVRLPATPPWACCAGTQGTVRWPDGPRIGFQLGTSAGDRRQELACGTRARHGFACSSSVEPFGSGRGLVPTANGWPRGPAARVKLYYTWPGLSAQTVRQTEGCGAVSQGGPMTSGTGTTSSDGRPLGGTKAAPAHTPSPTWWLRYSDKRLL